MYGRCCSQTASTFDLSVWEFWSALVIRVARLVIVEGRRSRQRSPEQYLLDVMAVLASVSTVLQCGSVRCWRQFAAAD